MPVWHPVCESIVLPGGFPLLVSIAKGKIDRPFFGLPRCSVGDMAVLFRLILLFTLVPLADLSLLIAIAVRWGHPALTFVLVIATGVLGAILARKQGFRWRQEMTNQLQRGELPADGLLDGLMIFVAGALLLTPGILTDLVGFALLFAPLRSVVRARIKRKIVQSLGMQTDARYQWGATENPKTTNRDVVIESYVIENSRQDSEAE